MKINNYIMNTLCLMVLCSLVACGGGGGGNGAPVETTPTAVENNSAPTLVKVADKSLVISQTLEFKLSASDINGDQYILSADGTAGTSANPFAQSSPATFNQETGTFQWTPTTNEIGQYDVKFTVKENTTDALETSILVNITVDTISNISKQLYTINCSSCHGIDGTGILTSGSDIRLKTALDISSALANVASMRQIINKLEFSQIDLIERYLRQLQLGNDSHKNFNLSNGCVVCHDGTGIIGKSINHMSTTHVCQSCHNIGASFSPAVVVDHNQVTAVCSSCHNGGTAPAKNATHIISNNDCNACHNTSRFSEVPVVNHLAVIGNCAGCHNGTTARAKSAAHIPTNGDCSGCHNTSIFNKDRSVAHQKALGFCADCHNNTFNIAPGKQVGHQGTNFDCGGCHNTNSF